MDMSVAEFNVQEGTRFKSTQSAVERADDLPHAGRCQETAQKRKSDGQGHVHTLVSQSYSII